MSEGETHLERIGGIKARRTISEGADRELPREEKGTRQRRRGEHSRSQCEQGKRAEHDDDEVQQDKQDNAQGTTYPPTFQLYSSVK